MTRITKGLVLAGIIALCMSGGAVAAKKMTGTDIINGSLTGKEFKTGSIGESRLSQAVQRKLNTTVSGSAAQPGPQGPKGDTGATGPQGPKGDRGDKGHVGISELETDGPYPGAAIPPLSGDQGDQSTAKWHAYWPTGDHDLQRSWVQCAPGKVALGGGFGRNDDRSDDVQIVTSAPAQIEDGQLIYSAIEGDDAGSFVPNAWLVEGYNFTDQDLIVRPWVICAKLAA